MLQLFKKISWILLLAFGQQAAWAFSLGGPIGTLGDAWQVPTIGYGLGGDLLAPKNLGEEYRRNIPVMYYACDANFLDFFGSNGVVAINQSFALLNSSLTNVDGYSTGLTEFPLNSQSINYAASALELSDLKSMTMVLMVEQLGLTDPVRYAWTLHDRATTPGGVCPADQVYNLVQRNFDISATPLNQVQYSPYVNGTLWTYWISEACTGPNPLALANPVQVDPLADGATALASSVNPVVIPTYQLGGFYTGLTRDDEAGLRYLLTTNNINWETPYSGSLLLSSAATGGINYGPPFVLYTSNYTAFAEAALTNDPVTMSNLFPGLIITSSTAHFAYQPTVTYVAYYTNLIGAPAGTLTLVVAPVVTYSVVTTYTYTFANVIATTNSGGSVGTVYTVTVGPLSGAPAGSPNVTNTAISYVSQPNVPTGDYYINTNACGTNLIIQTLATIPSYTTNVIYSATNALGQSALQYVVTTSYTHIYVVESPICAGSSGGGATTNAPGLYQGIGQIQFVASSYDSLIGQYYQPITNTYSMHLISNSKLINQTYQRVITAPDFLMSAADLAAGPASYPPGASIADRNINLNPANALPALDGPGTIDPATTITFDKVGNVYENVYLGNEATAGLSIMTWGSFDGSTNDPVVYPNGTSIANLANQVLVQIAPATLPNGTNGVAYPIQSFAITGGSFMPPYTWSLSSGGLPAGLKLNSDGTITSPTSNVTPGKPTQTGTFDFTIQLTDVLSRSVTWNYTLTIN